MAYVLARTQFSELIKMESLNPSVIQLPEPSTTVKMAHRLLMDRSVLEDPAVVIASCFRPRISDVSRRFNCCITFHQLALFP